MLTRSLRADEVAVVGSHQRIAEVISLTFLRAGPPERPAMANC